MGERRVWTIRAPRPQLLGVLLLLGFFQQGKAQEKELLETCGECSFYKYPNGSLFREGECARTCTGLLRLTAQITEIHPGTFSNLTSLEELWMMNNLLTEIKPGTFSGLPSLTKLDLMANPITDIQPGAFAGLDSLTYLELEGCQFSQIRSGVFSGLTSLQSLIFGWAYAGKVSEIHHGAFSGLLSLQTLRLNGNKLTQIDSDTFKGLTSLQHLGLSWNQITDLQPGTFSGLTSLYRIELSSNQLTEIQSGMFSNLTLLQEIDLSGNQLKQIDPDTFAGLTSLQSVAMYGNRFGCVVEDIVDLQVSWNKLPECPSNCTTSTYFNLDEGVCVSCPEGTSLGWIGSSSVEDCKNITTSPDLISCPTGSSWFNSTCLLDPLIPSNEVSTCEFGYTWDDLIFTEFHRREVDFKTGGLGSLMTPRQMHTWICEKNHRCVNKPHDFFCFTFDEQRTVFYPWGRLSELKLGGYLNLR